MKIAVIGGGFYGCCVAEFLGRGGANVDLFERSDELVTRASYNNQARLHGGYHYPRSFGTAYRSRLNMALFMNDFRTAVETSFVKLYAIARANSKITPRQFERFCAGIDAPLWPADRRHLSLFEPRQIEAVYRTDEFAFDAGALRGILEQRLAGAAVRIHRARDVIEVDTARAPFRLTDQTGDVTEADWVVNCTYSHINSIRGLASTRHRLKHEIAELALIELPPALAGISVTVMDGPFFSFMPFPDRRCTTLSHVRYTPHTNWTEDENAIRDPYIVLEEYDKKTNYGFMIRDAARYMPPLGGAAYRDSLFEVKTVLVKNELDDGRPILFEWAATNPRLLSVLGSKLDNIYDLLTALEAHVRGH